ncbi:HdeD family acid-resistance protein [Chelativorans sp. AA-79]|uniref:HdeD family acid-resistance protein n=1 Tax=Chelativorans sp. AA-79 TaxID=3028735 RepID=UPI0023F67DC2|nr:HdeD family acid-resistance protein [Chelativorans sp. AA-79]WEX08835.1 HdeD family acid-resistance protein [Chelativorans sp. AA-79]
MVGTTDLASGGPELKARWGWVVALGVVFLIAGIVALGSVVTATVASVFVVGVMMTLAGVAEIIHGFQMRTWGRFFLWILIGALYVVAGFIAFSNPLLASVVLTLLLGIGLIAAGIVRGILAAQLRGAPGWGWILFSAVITVIVGVMIVAGWPATSLFVLGTFLGIDLIFAGAGWIAAGLALRNA